MLTPRKYNPPLFLNTYQMEENASQRKHTRKSWMIYFICVLVSLVFWTTTVMVFKGCSLSP